MNKTLFLFIAFVLLSPVFIQAQDIINVSGYVTNEINGDPVPNHEVNIMVTDSMGYVSVALTNQNGFYFDSIPTGGMMVSSLYIYTYDLCTSAIHDTLVQDPGSQVTADFNICVDSVNNPECQASFGYILDSVPEPIVFFYDLSTPANAITSWSWDFGDGNTSSLQNPVHEYSLPGTYNVCLTIEVADSGTMCTDTYCTDVTVTSGGGGDCEADFYYVQDSTAELLILFFDQSIPANAITSWSWEFGDGNTSSAQNPVHQYSQPGTYTACLTIEVADSGTMCTDTYCMNVIVSSGGGFECEADFYFTIDSNEVSPVVHFYDNSTPAGMIDSWFWEFGDGTSSTDQNPVHTYPGAGTYSVCLTISADSMGCTSTACDSIMINAVSQYQLGGNVFAGMYQLDHGFAYAYKSENGVITNVYAEMIDTLGYYLFYPLVAADYYLKVEPSPSSAYYGSYMPTYFGDVVTWEDAVMVGLTQVIFTADINLVPMAQASAGPGQISGSIVHEGTLRDGIPAEGVQIMLINELGEYVGLEYSDEEGLFTFASLPYGTYSLHAEVAGLTMHPEDFTLSEGNEVIDNISMVMNDEEIYFGPSSIEVLEDITLSEVYPNPVTSNLRLELGSSNPTDVTVRILNQFGQLLKVQKVDLQQGQILELNTDDLSSGMYLLEVITRNNFRAVRKFVKM